MRLKSVETYPTKAEMLEALTLYRENGTHAEPFKAEDGYRIYLYWQAEITHGGKPLKRLSRAFLGGTHGFSLELHLSHFRALKW